MKLPVRKRTLLKLAGLGLFLLLAAALAAPYFSVDQYARRLQSSLERALGRKVELGRVHFSLLEGPAFTVDSVTIYEDPAIGIEPVAYVQDPGSLRIAPSLLYLAVGRFVISSISLDGASINLTKSGPASEPGRWNFASFVNRSVMRNPIALHVRDSRVNFKFGDTKSGFYLTETDLDITPPGPGGSAWKVRCSARPARTDRSGLGLGSFTLNGRWYLSPERVDLDLSIERAGLDELTALVRGQAGNIHGSLSSDLHLGGPIGNIGIKGQLRVEDVHRWDLLPPHGQGWPFEVSGRLDLLKQELELQSNSAGTGTLPLTVRFRATDYLTQPRWAVAANWNRFPVEPLMQLAAHMGAQFPARLKLSGSMDGAIGYSGQGGLQGELGFHDAAMTIPDSPPLQVKAAYFVVGGGHVRLSPAEVSTSTEDQALVEADYDIDDEALDLAIRTDGMNVASLREQVSLAAVPWLEQVRSGSWSGLLRYQHSPGGAGWSGQLQVRDAELAVPGLAQPLQLASARAQIDDERVVLDRMDAHVGEVAFTGDYRYEPRAARPHRVRLRAGSVDAADLEAALLPTLKRSSSLLARALGRASLPGWLKDRAVEGTIQIGDLAVGEAHLEGVRAHMVWDLARVEFDSISARLDEAQLSGVLTVSVRAERPVYRLVGRLKGLEWQSGTIDAEGTAETSGTGGQLLANLTSQGTFAGSALDFGPAAAWRNVSGAYALALGPRLRFTVLNLRTEDELYTGRGSTQDDGRLVIQLNSGLKEMRMSGTLAKMKIDEGLKQ